MKAVALLIGSALILTLNACTSVPQGKSANTQRDMRTRSSQMATDISRSDIEAEVQFGQELAARILGKYRMYENKKATRYINLIGKGLAAQSSRPEIDFKFAILNTDMVNAFAAPGGYIFVTKGTLEIIDNEAQLAAVLAHEIAHVTERHIVKELDIKGRDTSAGAGLASILGGGTSETVRAAFTQLVDKASEILFKRGLKQEDEMASDELSIMLVSNSGYNAIAYKDLLKKIDRKKSKKNMKKNTAILSATHPSLKDRIAALDKIIEEEKLNELNYANVKGRYGKYVKF